MRERVLGFRRKIRCNFCRVWARFATDEADVEANINSKDIIGKLARAIRAVPTTESVRRSGEARGRGWLTSAMSATIRHDLAAGPQVTGVDQAHDQCGKQNSV